LIAFRADPKKKFFKSCLDQNLDLKMGVICFCKVVFGAEKSITFFNGILGLEMMALTTAKLIADPLVKK